jgi:hypothetical protein
MNSQSDLVDFNQFVGKTVQENTQIAISNGFPNLFLTGRRPEIFYDKPLLDPSAEWPPSLMAFLGDVPLLDLPTFFDPRRGPKSYFRVFIAERTEIKPEMFRGIASECPFLEQLYCVTIKGEFSELMRLDTIPALKSLKSISLDKQDDERILQALYSLPAIECIHIHRISFRGAEEFRTIFDTCSVDPNILMLYSSDHWIDSILINTRTKRITVFQFDCFPDMSLRPEYRSTDGDKLIRDGGTAELFLAFAARPDCRKFEKIILEGDICKKRFTISNILEASSPNFTLELSPQMCKSFRQGMPKHAAKIKPSTASRLVNSDDEDGADALSLN